MTGRKAPHLRLSPGVYIQLCVCVCVKEDPSQREKFAAYICLYMQNVLEWQSVCVMEGVRQTLWKCVCEPQIAHTHTDIEREGEWERLRVLKGADEAGLRLQARSGHRCGRRVKLSSHYHADTRANNGGSICSCQPLQIWCHPVRWRQQAAASNQTAQAPPARKSSHRLHTHSLSG